MTDNPKFNRPFPGIERHIVTSTFERYFECLVLFSEPVIFPLGAELIQYLFLARLIPILRDIV